MTPGADAASEKESELRELMANAVKEIEHAQLESAVCRALPRLVSGMGFAVLNREGAAVCEAGDAGDVAALVARDLYAAQELETRRRVGPTGQHLVVGGTLAQGAGSYVLVLDVSAIQRLMAKLPVGVVVAHEVGPANPSPSPSPSAT